MNRARKKPAASRLRDVQPIVVDGRPERMAFWPARPMRGCLTWPALPLHQAFDDGSSTILAATAPPAARAIPDRSTSGGNQQRLEQLHFAGAEQIPGDDPDENTDAFGDRYRGGRFSQDVQLAKGACCPASPQPAQSRSSWSGPPGQAQTASRAKKCRRVAAKNCSQLSLNSFIFLSFLAKLGTAADDSDARPARLQSLRQLSVTFCDSGQARVKRAPPSGDSAALAVPWCCSMTNCTIASPRP